MRTVWCAAMIAVQEARCWVDDGAEDDDSHDEDPFVQDSEDDEMGIWTWWTTLVLTTQTRPMEGY